MKKLLGLSFFLCCFYSGFSQLGMRAAVNQSGASFSIGEADIDVSSEIGFDVGILYSIQLNDNLFIQPEAHYVPIAATAEFMDANGQPDPIKITLNYLEVPVLIKFKFLHGSATQPFILAGPSFGYALSGSNEEGGESIDVDFDNDDTSRNNLGLKVGGGVEFGKLFIDVRYSLGLSNIMEQEGASYKTKGIQLGLGYMF